MRYDDIGYAANLLLQAREHDAPLERLPETSRPTNFAEAHAIQDAATARLGQPVAGWKVFVTADGVCRGSLLAPRVLTSPGALPSGSMRTRGAEGEIAFRFLRDLPPRQTDYTFDEVAEAVAAGPAIEVVESRYADMNDVSWPERVADHFCNGGFAHGAFRDDWHTLDLERVVVTLTIDGTTSFEGTGGHPAGHPLRPAVALVNLMRKEGGVKAGQIATTGSFTGMRPSRVGEALKVTFEGLGSAELRFVP